MLFNGEPLTKGAKRQLGFVLQDDLLYESLTVYETLYFAAMLRLPKTMTTAQKRDAGRRGHRRARPEQMPGHHHRRLFPPRRLGWRAQARLRGARAAHQPLGAATGRAHVGPRLDDRDAAGDDAARRWPRAGERSRRRSTSPAPACSSCWTSCCCCPRATPSTTAGPPLATDWFPRLGYRMPYGVNAADFLLDVASGDVVASAGRRREGGDEGGVATRRPLLLRPPLLRSRARPPASI